MNVMYAYACTLVYIQKAGEKMRVSCSLGLLLDCSCISRKNTVDCRVSVTVRAAPKAEISLRWLTIHIFAGREGNAIPWLFL